MLKTRLLGRHKTIRKHLTGTSVRPRLAVFRSSQHIYAQIIDDSQSKTLVSVSDIKETLTDAKSTKKEKAYQTGKNLAEKAKKAKITTVVFDRGGFSYQGRVEQLAKGAREGGLEF